MNSYKKKFQYVNDPFIDGHYKLNRIDALILGIWPEQSLLLRILLPACHTIFMITIIIPEVNRFLQVLDDLDLFMNCVPSFIVIFIAGFKLYSVSLNNAAIITHIREDWVRYNNAFTGSVIHKYATIGYMMTLGYQVSLYSGLFLFISLPIIPVVLDMIIPLNESRERPSFLETDYGVDPNDYYVLIGLHAFLCTFQLIHTFATVDSLVCILVEHTCALFEIIGVILHQLNDETKNLTDRENYEIISEAIEVHEHALRFSKILNSIFSKMYAAVVICNVMAISMTGLMMLIVVEKKDYISAIRFAVYFVGTIIHLFSNSVPGQELYDHSDAVDDAIYNCNWRMLPVEANKLIKFMMMRSMYPCMLQAGGFYTMNFANFGSVLQTAISYMTLFTSIR